MNSRMLALLGLLALALLIRVVDPWKVNAADEVVQARPRATAPALVAAAPTAETGSAQSKADLPKPLAWPARAPIEREFSDPFALPAPPAPVAAIAPRPVVPVQAAPVNVDPPAPPPAPRAPPLPFTAIGHWNEDDKMYAFVADARGTLKVQVGDLIDGNYRVDEITPGRINLTYMPLNEQQQLTWALTR